MQRALVLYQSSGRFWTFKCSIIAYVAHCYLDSGNAMLFNPNYNPANLQCLREIIQHIADDINLIYEEWHMIETDCKLILPDNSISSFSKEAKQCALDNICDFFISLLKNKKVDLGVDMFPTFYEITTKIAKLYYETKNETYKSNAMDVL